MNRKIKLEGLHNCRDLGGLRTKDGAVIRRNCLLRSEQLLKATDRDKELLRDQYRVRKVIDLRTPMERMQMAEGDIPGAKMLSLPVFEDLRVGLSHEKSALEEVEKIRAQGGIPPLSNLYRNIAMQEECRVNIGQALRAVLENDYEKGSILWHCTEGKDRCGILSALVLMVLDVSRDDIMEDYLLTNDVNRAKSEKVYHYLLSQGKSEQAAASVREAFLAKEEYLGAFLDLLDEEFADPMECVTEALGVPLQMVEKFRAAVLEG